MGEQHSDDSDFWRPRERKPGVFWLSTLMTVLVVALMLTTALVLVPHIGDYDTEAPVAHPRAPTPPTVITRAETRIPISDISFTDVVTVSPQDAWAIGTSASRPTIASGSGIFEYSQGHWRRAFQLPMMWLTHLRMLSPTEGWASGWNYADATKLGVIAHILNGHVWLTYFTEPVEALDALARRDVWAACSTVFVHYDGQQWTSAPAPRPTWGKPLALSMLSDAEGWAAGENGALFHYSSGVWRHWGTRMGADLYGIQMLSPTDGWAVGWNVATDGAAVVLHYNGTQWTRVDTGKRVEWLHALSLTSPREGWVVGGFTGARGSNLMLHYDGARWASVPLPTAAELDGVSVLPSQQGWAVGLGVILRYRNGKWSQYSDATSLNVPQVTTEGARLLPDSL